MPSKTRPGIFCMEGAWSPGMTDVRTVTPVLQALSAANKTRYLRHHLASPEDLKHQLQQWPLKHYDPYAIGYLALHGDPQTVYIGNQEISLTEIEEWAPRTLGGKVLHFGSCSVLDIPKGRREEFRAAIGARAVTGFTRQVEWFESLAFEMLLFEALTYWPQRIDLAEAYLKDVAGSLGKKTGFVMVRG